MKKVSTTNNGFSYVFLSENEAATAAYNAKHFAIRASDFAQVITDLPFDEQPDVRAMRAKRNALLAESDWTVLSDAPLTTAQKTAWKAYRDELRNFPTNWTAEKVWPVKP